MITEHITIVIMSVSHSILSLSFQDALPSAWSRGGAKKVDIDAVLPFIILPLILSISTLSLTATVVVMVLTVMGVLYVYSRPLTKNRSPFFFSWTLASSLCMFLVFEVALLDLLEITQLEHFIFLLLSACTFYCFYKMKEVADSELAMGSSKGNMYSPVLTADSYYCKICQIEVNERLFHSIWWDCCILRPNYCYFLAGQIFAFATLLHGINLSITTICHPFQFYGSVLLPDDCTDVYFDFQSALIFVSSVYGLGYGCAITLVLLKQLWKLLLNLK